MEPQTDDILSALIAYSKEANFWLKSALYVALIWPLISIAAAMLLNPHNAQTIVPIINLIPIFAVALSAIGAALDIALLLRNATVKKGFAYFLGFIGVELTIGIYLSIIPISKDNGLVPLLLLTALALLFLRIGGFGSNFRFILAMLLIAMTITFLAGGRAAVTSEIHDAFVTAPPKAALVFADYHAEHCEKDESTDFRDGKSEQFVIALQAGCFHGPITLDPNWDTFEVVHSRAEGDWVAVWCDGSPMPKNTLPAYEDFPNDFISCKSASDTSAKFFAQGRGTLRFRVLTYKRPPQASNLSAGEPLASEPPHNPPLVLKFADNSVTEDSVPDVTPGSPNSPVQQAQASLPATPPSPAPQVTFPFPWQAQSPQAKTTLPAKRFPPPPSGVALATRDGVFTVAIWPCSREGAQIDCQGYVRNESRKNETFTFQTSHALDSVGHVYHFVDGEFGESSTCLVVLCRQMVDAGTALSFSFRIGDVPEPLRKLTIVLVDQLEGGWPHDVTLHIPITNDGSDQL